MVMQVIEAVERALNASKSERDGLGGRVSDAHSSAAILAGNRTDESTSSAKLPREYEAEIANRRRRLDQLDYAIGQFERLEAELMTRFSSVLSTHER